MAFFHVTTTSRKHEEQCLRTINWALVRVYMCVHLCGKIPHVVLRQALTLLADAGLELAALLPLPPEC